MITIKTKAAPEAVGPYSQGIVVEGMVFCSGQIALDPESMEMVGDTAGEQTRQVLVNLSEVLKAGGCAMEKVAKTTVYLADMADYAEVNAAYADFFGKHQPARAAVEVSRLPKDAKVEIECIGVL